MTEPAPKYELNQILVHRCSGRRAMVVSREFFRNHIYEGRSQQTWMYHIEADIDLVDSGPEWYIDQRYVICPATEQSSGIPQPQSEE